MKLKVGQELMCIKEDDGLFPVNIDLRLGEYYRLIGIHDGDRSNKYVLAINGAKVAYRLEELPIYFDIKSIVRSKRLKEVLK